MRSAIIWCFLLLTYALGAAEPALTRTESIALLAPYGGVSQRGVDTSTLTGKIVTGYQGWFNVPGDGSGRGWTHLGRRGVFAPGRCNIEIWPDVSELPPSDRFPTEFRLADGSVAEIFSSFRQATVDLHFKWMREYGIDGAFVQRFANELGDAKAFHHRNTVLNHARAAANQTGRGYVVMYDLSGLTTETFHRVADDWKILCDHMRIGRDEKDLAYFKHRGKPLVVVWGVGFNDDRGYSLKDCEQLIDFLKDDPKYGGNTIMVGVPYYTRELKADAINEVDLHRVLKKADIINPWSVGRFSVDRDSQNMINKTVKPDIAWCDKHGWDYMPIIWPGFSWHNMREGETKFDQIPRQGGQFMWRQANAVLSGGAKMIYVAMFDELDEGTAIFKCSNNPPIGASPFLREVDVPSDHYLWLTGQIGRALRGEIPASSTMPMRPKQ